SSSSRKGAVEGCGTALRSVPSAGTPRGIAAQQCPLVRVPTCCSARVVSCAAFHVIVRMSFPRFLEKCNRSQSGSPLLTLHLVALNTPLSGDMRGIRGADFQCYQQARAMGLLSTYRAFLSSHLQDLATVVKKGERFSLPIVNLKGEVLFINWMAIFSGDGGAFEPRVPIYSFDGRNVMTDPSWPQKMVWHGSSAAGIRTTSGYCEAWRAGDAAVTGQASALQSGRLLGQHTRGCSNRFVVLCVENSYVAEPRRT
uniref:Collagenase NC10/endostatin domain-containing protein n=1 Tax=Scleropages formosus TaxID=113540 RepID=A0A8C9T2P6_SCLFO